MTLVINHRYQFSPDWYSLSYKMVQIYLFFSRWQRHKNNSLDALRLGVKPYACTMCDMKFFQRYHLARHSLTHTGMGPCTVPITCSVRNQCAHLILLVHFRHMPVTFKGNVSMKFKQGLLMLAIIS